MCVLPTPGRPMMQMANLSAEMGKMLRGMLWYWWEGGGRRDG